MSSLKEYLSAIGIIAILFVIGYTAYERNQRIHTEMDNCRSQGKQAFVDRRYNVICIKG